MKIILRKLFFVSLFFATNCGCDQEPIWIYSPPEEKIVKLNMYPNSAHIGYKLTITSPDSVDFGYPTIYFPDSIYVYPDSIINDTLYVTVPYCTSAGPLSIISSKIHATTDIFSPLIGCREDICISKWDLNYDITEEDSYDRWGWRWNYQLKNDTIHLYLDADGPNYEKVINLYFSNDNTNNLPKFISGDYYFFSGGTSRYTIERAVFKIYRWDLNGVVAGILFFTPNRYWPRIEVFWVDMSK